MKPIWAKSSDLYGRAAIYPVALGFVTLGLVLAASAKGFGQFSLGTVLRVWGITALNTLNTTVIADITTTRQRGFGVNFQFFPYLVLPVSVFFSFVLVRCYTFRCSSEIVGVCVHRLRYRKSRWYRMGVGYRNNRHHLPIRYLRHHIPAIQVSAPSQEARIRTFPKATHDNLGSRICDRSWWFDDHHLRLRVHPDPTVTCCTPATRLQDTLGYRPHRSRRCDAPCTSRVREVHPSTTFRSLELVDAQKHWTCVPSLLL